ncbi:MAG TPA: hypothetical protein VL854_10475 [Nitrososphaeraceae archaeon]|nr:hypothetical protein [Nitrososphaeraceae archaeon]
MIKTDWIKCDNKECDRIAFSIASNEKYGINVNVCVRHESHFEGKRGWKISNLEGNYTT